MPLLDLNTQTKSLFFCVATSLVLHMFAICSMKWLPFALGDGGEMQVLEVSVVAKQHSTANANSRVPNAEPVQRPSNQSEAKVHPANKQNSNELASQNQQQVDALSGNTKSLGLLKITKWPTVVREKKAEYPIMARKNGIEGTVALRVQINELGEPVNVEIIEGPGQGLNEAAADALREYRFSPAFVRDQPVGVSIIYRYNFEIR